MRYMNAVGFLAIFTIQACGSAGGTNVVSPNLPAQVNSTGPFAYDSASDTVQATFTYNNANIAAFPAGISSYRYTLAAQSTSEYLIRGVTPSGQGIAMIHETASGPRVYLERTAPITISGTGNATFTGNYAGAYSRSSSGGIVWGHMIGDASIDLDLDAGQLTGTISNRQNTGGLPASDIIFSSFDFANGEFTASLTGSGAFNSDTSLDYSPPSAAQGMIVGPNGQEIIVTTRFLYRTGNVGTGPIITHSENGVITATQN